VFVQEMIKGKQTLFKPEACLKFQNQIHTWDASGLNNFVSDLNLQIQFQKKVLLFLVQTHKKFIRIRLLISR